MFCFSAIAQKKEEFLFCVPLPIEFFLTFELDEIETVLMPSNWYRGPTLPFVAFVS
jgi:hypothetical protein